MGSVWLAERCDGRFEGRAAVKLLNLALVGRAGEERFRREGNILARLTHPHIAHLVDAGVSPTGQPYLVLEHVDGQPIDRYCDEQALGIEARVRLFLDVLEAVAHAHANLIVHRDIKPANVLVSVDGQVKLLDFGIAKLLDGDGRWGGRGAPRRARSRARRRGADAGVRRARAGDRRTGHHRDRRLRARRAAVRAAHRPASRRARPCDRRPTLMRAIVDASRAASPTRSSADRDSRKHSAQHAARCGTTPARLRRTLRGDLDTIVAKALKKHAPERYASVTALADDLRRYLRHEPISARPDTLRYRTATFVRRHVRGVATTAAILVLLGGVTGFYTTRLATERDRAQREAAKAAKVSELLTGLLTGADPYATRATRRGTDRARAARRRRRSGAEGARRPARSAGRDADGDGTDLSAAGRLRQGAAASRTGARPRAAGVRAGARHGWPRA